MPTIDLGLVKGDTGASMRMAGEWTANASYVNNNQYIDVVTNGGNSYSCKTSHTSGSTFSDTNWTMIAKKGDKGNKGDTGTTPTIQAGTATSLDATASPTVTSTTSGTTTTFNFGIPKGDTSKFETPTFMDTVNTYTTLSAANTAAETASNAIKSKVSIFTTLSNMKKSFSAIVQGLKILATNVGAINGITSDINSESTTIAASSKMVHDLNASLSNIGKTISKNIVETVAPINTEITLGEITLDPGAWIVLLNVWNPPELGMSSVMLGLQESGDSVIVTGHLTQALSFVVPKIRTTYHIIYAQWGKESITVTNGSIKAIRIA